VYEDDDCVAFLDRRPVFLGHTLVVPRTHAATLRELPIALVGPLFSAVQLVAAGVQRGLSADGTWIAINNVVSQSVPHLHVHVVPRRFQDGLRGFFWPRQRYEDEAQMAGTAASIRAAITAMRSS
jgi:histidine triad (HIT) family protein